MAARSMRSQRYLSSEALLQVDYHGLDTSNQLRSHAEEFQKAKAEIALGKRRRRNSINDTRNLENIAADGPDRRFENIQIPDSGIRDGLAARFYMPAFPNVQDFTRRSARWEDEEQWSVSQDEKSADSSSRDSIYRGDSLASELAQRSLAANQHKSTSGESVSTQAAVSEKRASRIPSASGGPKADEIFYRCYAKGCKYQHVRRGNFSIHWKRDAKHAGTFDLKKVLHCSHGHVNGKINTMPYGQVKVYRQRQSSGPKDDMSAAITDQPSSVLSKKRKAPAHEELPRRTRTRSTTVSASNNETRLQGLDPTDDDAPTNLARANNPCIYSTLECQIFKSLKDVPVNFPTHLAPLISHGGPHSKSSHKATSDCRYFCPECQKCFTQTHNVASHFSRAHGRKYSKNDRDHTVCCRATVSQGRVNIDAKPIDETILPRLVQISQQRSRSSISSADSTAAASDTDRDGQVDAPPSRRRDKAVPASFLINTIEAVIPERPVLAFTFTTPLGLNKKAVPPRQSSERIRRMQAVREGILSRTNAPALASLNRPNEPSEDPRAETVTDTQSSTNGDDHCERDEGTGTTSHEHDTYHVMRQPSWHDIGQPTPGQNSHKRKRTVSIATDKNGDDRSSEGAGKPKSPGDTEGFAVKDAKGTTIKRTTKAAEAQIGAELGPKVRSIHMAVSGSQSEQKGQVPGLDEQNEDAEVEEEPAKRRKMTLAEYMAMGRGIGAQLEKA